MNYRPIIPPPHRPPNTLLGGKAYTPSSRTDLRATFERIRQQQKGQK